MGVDGVKRDFSVVDIVPEVVELDIDVLGLQAHLWDLGNFECPQRHGNGWSVA